MNRSSNSAKTSLPTPALLNRRVQIGAALLLATSLTGSLWGTANAATKTTKKATKTTKKVAATTVKPAVASTVVTTPLTAAPIPTAAPGAKFATMAEITALCPPATAPKKLVFTTFPGQKARLDYMTETFTKATGVDIEWLENGLGDRLTKMNVEKGSPTIDVALVPVGEVPALLANGVTEKTDTKLPNYEQLIPVAKMDGGYGISVLQFGIAYNPKYIKTPPKTWKDLLDLRWTGKVALPAMPNSGGYAFLTMISRLGGGDERDLASAINQVSDFKSNVHSFIGSSITVEEQIKSGEIWMYVDIGGVAEAAKLTRSVPVEFVVPNEGAPVSINSLVIPAGNPRSGCAKAFVAYLLGEESQLAWAQTLYYGSSSTIIKFPDTLNKSLYPKPGATNIVPMNWAAVAQKSADTMDLWNRKVVS